MIEKQDISQLIKNHNLMNCEIDSRHLALINEIFQLGINTGINQAKESVIWRINGPMWAPFIDKKMTKDQFIDEND